MASGFPRLAFFTPDLGHGYDFLPVGDAVRWMDALSSADPDALLAFARKRAEQRGWRDVAAALLRAGELKVSAKFKGLEDKLNAAAKKDAAKHLRNIQANKDGSWVDSFPRWRDEFAFAPAARETMEVYHGLRDQHDAGAEPLIGEARRAFRSRDADTGWSKYQEIVDKLHACRRYRVVKRWLEERPQ